MYFKKIEKLLWNGADKKTDMRNGDNILFLILLCLSLLASIFLIIITFETGATKEPLDISIRGLVAIGNIFTFALIQTSIFLLFVLSSRTITGIIYKCIVFLTVLSLPIFLFSVVPFLFLEPSYILYWAYLFKFSCTVILSTLWIIKLAIHT